ncbi:hypothetical protein SNEBB_001547 [Seison nebaliae]|nr:hypothetical protein SNEBB_001547 [Seison nebaliae]
MQFISITFIDYHDGKEFLMKLENNTITYDKLTKFIELMFEGKKYTMVNEWNNPMTRQDVAAVIDKKMANMRFYISMKVAVKKTNVSEPVTTTMKTAKAVVPVTDKLRQNEFVIDMVLEHFDYLIRMMELMKYTPDMDMTMRMEQMMRTMKHVYETSSSLVAAHLPAGSMTTEKVNKRESLFNEWKNYDNKMNSMDNKFKATNLMDYATDVHYQYNNH